MKSVIGLPMWAITFAVAYTPGGILIAVLNFLRPESGAINDLIPIGAATGVTIGWAIRNRSYREKMKVKYGEDWESIVKEEEDRK